jgi:hypothetical protein
MTKDTLKNFCPENYLTKGLQPTTTTTEVDICDTRQRAGIHHPLKKETTNGLTTRVETIFLCFDNSQNFWQQLSNGAKEPKTEFRPALAWRC